MKTTAEFKEALKNRNVVQIGESKEFLLGKSESYKLQKHFERNMKRYKGFWSKNVNEILAKFNSYLKEKGLSEMEFRGNLNEYYIPFGELELQVRLLTPYTGKHDEDDLNYISADYFIMNDKTTKKDVDLLIDFLKQI